MKIKLLLVDLKEPEKTKYKSPKQIGTYLLGRTISNFVVVSCPENKIIDLSPCNGDVQEITALLESHCDGSFTNMAIKQECLRLCRGEQPIAAIRYHREMMNSSLKEAKEYVDNLRTEYGIPFSFPRH